MRCIEAWDAWTGGDGALSNGIREFLDCRKALVGACVQYT